MSATQAQGPPQTGPVGGFDWLAETLAGARRSPATSKAKEPGQEGSGVKTPRECKCLRREPESRKCDFILFATQGSQTLMKILHGAAQRGEPEHREAAFQFQLGPSHLQATEPPNGRGNGTHGGALGVSGCLPSRLSHAWGRQGLRQTHQTPRRRLATCRLSRSVPRLGPALCRGAELPSWAPPGVGQ